MNKYRDLMTYHDFYNAVQSVKPCKEGRALNRAAKKRGYGNMVPIYNRYPDLALHISLVAFVISLAATILSFK